MTHDDLPPPPPSQIPRMFAGFATIITANLVVVAILSLLPFLLNGWAGAAIGLLQLVWAIPIAVWRFAVKDAAFAGGALIGAALTLLLNIGGVALYGFVALCGGF